MEEQILSSQFLEECGAVGWWGAAVFHREVGAVGSGYISQSSPRQWEARQGGALVNLRVDVGRPIKHQTEPKHP